MIGTVMHELEESAVAQLPSRITAIQGIRATELAGATLDTDFKVYDWWEIQAKKVIVEFPALTLAWDSPTKSGQRNGSKQRESNHRVTATYGVRHSDIKYIERHVLYVPEAILLWLDELPTASRVPGKTIVGLDRADGNEIEISHDVESLTGGFFIWSVAVSFTVIARDSNLPDRAT